MAERDAANAGLLLRLDSAYQFLHDRVQEPVCAPSRGSANRTASADRPLLLAHTPEERLAREIFAIVSQLNRGAALMGEASVIAALPAYQLALPFTHEAQRVMDYIPLVRRMTLCDFAS